jgi:REP element-mobilizing transposase RayT
MSELYQSLSHSRWNCKYHVVFIEDVENHVLWAWSEFNGFAS